MTTKRHVQPRKQQPRPVSQPASARNEEVSEPQSVSLAVAAAQEILTEEATSRELNQNIANLVLETWRLHKDEGPTNAEVYIGRAVVAYLVQNNI